MRQKGSGMKLTEKAAYIKGLADGVEYDKNTKEGKLIAALIDMVDEMAKKIDVLDETIDELNDYIEEIDEDLGDVEECLCDGDCDDEDCDGDCENCDHSDECDVADEDEDDDEEGNEYFEIKCPSCGEVICFDESIDPEDLICPACHEKIACIVDEDDYKKVKEDKKN